jgi:hypothetical protein
LFDINHRAETLSTMLFHHMGPERVARKNFWETVTRSNYVFTEAGAGVTAGNCGQAERDARTARKKPSARRDG